MLSRIRLSGSQMPQSVSRMQPASPNAITLRVPRAKAPRTRGLLVFTMRMKVFVRSGSRNRPRDYAGTRFEVTRTRTGREGARDRLSSDSGRVCGVCAKRNVGQRTWLPARPARAANGVASRRLREPRPVGMASGEAALDEHRGDV